MDSELLAMDSNEIDEIGQCPTWEEAEALLREDPPPSVSQSQPQATTDANSPSDPGSPTAAVKSAIEAQIVEEMLTEISHFAENPKSKRNSVTDANKDSATPLPPLAPVAPKPTPLFPNGLPSFLQTKSVPKANPTNTNPPKTYAKVSTPPKKREVVDFILFVYSSHTVKSPLSLAEWEIVDDSIMSRMAKQAPDDPLLVRIANSGYDAAHKCGFIACRDLESQDWCKAVVRGIGWLSGLGRLTFRAWAKGEQPETRLCRLFFPSRFDKLEEDSLVPLIKKHNPPLKGGQIILKGCNDVQNGRAVFLEVDPLSFSYIKSKHHKLEFMMMDVDCQPYIPPSKVAVAQKVAGVTKLVKPSNDPRLNKKANAPNETSTAGSSNSVKATSPNSDKLDGSKRGRDELGNGAVDKSKKR